VSYKVSEIVIEQSRSKHGSRTVALIIAETAHHDGVGWLRQEPSKSVHRKGKQDDKSNIAFRTKLSPKQVRRCVDRLQELDELEVVWARDRGNRFYIYRLIVGPLRYADVDYSRGLPFLEGRFWTPEQLELPWHERPLEGHSLAPSQLARFAPTLVEDEADEEPEAAKAGGHFVPSFEGAREGTFAPEPGDISGRSAGGHPGTLLKEHSSLDLVLDPSLTDSTSKDEVESVSAGADDGRAAPTVKDLVAAYAAAVGYWPNGHDEWSAWCGALKPLADAGVEPSEIASRSTAYLAKWPLETKPDSPAFMFALTKVWQRVSASLERGYLGLYRWATESSWRLGDIDHARWVIEASDRITEEERAKLLSIVEETYRAHGDPRSEFLKWVESVGWTLDDEQWRHELAARTDPKQFKLLAPEMRRQGKERRLAIRKDFANLELFTRRSA
jgi:hypothetical protein